MNQGYGDPAVGCFIHLAGAVSCLNIVILRQFRKKSAEMG